MQPVQSGRRTAGRFQLVFQTIQKQRIDHLQDVAFAGVVGPLLATLIRPHHRLEQRPEDRRRDARPIEPRGGDQSRPHVAVKGGKPQLLAEQPAVDVRHGGQFLPQARLPLVLRRIERLEDERQFGPEVGPIVSGVRLDIALEDG